jgi:hypothetical protein
LSRVWQAYQEVVDHKKPEPKRELVI